jgi:hypothetical protein
LKIPKLKGAVPKRPLSNSLELESYLSDTFKKRKRFVVGIIIFQYNNKIQIICLLLSKSNNSDSLVKHDHTF